MASLGLVADYGSDEDSDGSFGVENDNLAVQSGNPAALSTTEVNTSAKPVVPQDGISCTDPVKSSDDGNEAAKNLLISQGDSSESDDEDIGEKKQTSKPTEKLPNPLLGKLLVPKLGKKSKKVKKIKVKDSVFTNPFEKAEIAKQSILEKHVKMTEAQSAAKNVKICFKFRKGRCPFKNNCRYSHDLDSNLSLRYQKDSAVEQGESSTASQRHGSKSHKPPPPQRHGFMGTVGTLSDGPPKQPPSRRSYAQYRQQLHDMEQQADDDSDVLSDKRKKRAGMAQSLVPPKKAMYALNKFRSEERPWTVSDY